MIHLLAETLTPKTVLDYIQSGGVAALLLLFVFGLYKRWFVMGWQYKAIEQSNIRWMEIALRSTNLAQSLDEVRKERPMQEIG